MRRLVWIALIALLFLFPESTTLAGHATGHTSPQGPAKVNFAPAFPSLTDSEWGFALGGFGGISFGGPLSHIPVIFVHGNNVDACDWYPVRDNFLDAGWTLQEMYALSYNVWARTTVQVL